MLKSSPGGFGALSGWGEAEGKLMGSLAAPRDAGDEVCLEKRVFYRLISGKHVTAWKVWEASQSSFPSGLHASISIHICDEYLDQKTGLWVSLPACSYGLIACLLIEAYESIRAQILSVS